MSWALLTALALAHVLVLLALRQRRDERDRQAQGVAQRDEAKAAGSHRARLQYPHVDLSRCIGCATCIAACPEDGVLDIIHGQASVVHGARCVGHGLCAQECPVGAIALTLADIEHRRDLPALTSEWESTQRPGLFLAGEVTGYALIRTAIGHGTAIADAVHRRLGEAGPRRPVADAPVALASVDAPVSALASIDAPVSLAAAEHPRSIARASMAGGERPASIARAAMAGASALQTAPPASAAAAAATAAATSVTDEVADAVTDVLDLVIVGAGPAGIACSLQAKSHGMRFVTLEQEELGGTVARYPRRKLVMTQPVVLPLHGRLARTSYSKEELMELWADIVKQHRLPLWTGVTFTGVDVADDGHFVVHTSAGDHHARNVCLALGRRGSPRKLGVPGEELPKVAYSLLDAQSYRGRRILVVGGGDSAIEAALGLSEQPGNRVTLSYRKPEFFRLKARNVAHLEAAVSAGSLDVLYSSEVTGISADAVSLRVDGEDSDRRLDNDELFVMAGGIAPFQLLEASGVSFDPADRPAAAPLSEQGTGLRPALVASLLLTLAVAGWLVAWADYYLLPNDQRWQSPHHELLRPARGLGLAFGLAACVCLLCNLTYLLRRSRWGRRLPGSLKGWMTAHVVTGILCLLLVLVHGGMAPRDTLGGHALLGLAVLLVTGAVGRYFYAFVPRAANGGEIALDDLRQRMAALSGEWDRDGRGFGDSVRGVVQQLVDSHAWSNSFGQRLGALFTSQRRLTRALATIKREAREAGLPADQIRRLLGLARRAHRTSLMLAHYEDLRGLLASWRFLHRWLAVLMLLLAAWHIVMALRYGQLLG